MTLFFRVPEIGVNLQAEETEMRLNKGDGGVKGRASYADTKNIQNPQTSVGAR